MTTTEIPTFDGIYFATDASTITGAVVRMDDGNLFGAKRVDEPRADAGYAGCDFRLGLNLTALAVNLKITGRVEKTWNRSGWMRCRIEFVGDYEPSTFVRGWVRVW